MKDVHKSRKIAVINHFREELEGLPIGSRYHIGRFVDEIQNRLTTIDGKVLRLQ